MSLYKTLLEQKYISFKNIPEIEIISWKINEPIENEEIKELLENSEFGFQESLYKFYSEMNGCEIIWNYDDKNGNRTEGHLVVFSIEDLISSKFNDNYDYDEEDFPGVNRLNKSAYICSQGEIDFCIDFRKGKNEILMTIQRDEKIIPIHLSLEQWFNALMITVGDKIWEKFSSLKKNESSNILNLDIKSWQILYPEFKDFLKNL